MRNVLPCGVAAGIFNESEPPVPTGTGTVAPMGASSMVIGTVIVRWSW